MKKVILYYILGIFVILRFGTLDAFAQAKFLLKNITIQVPAVETYFMETGCPSEVPDSTSKIFGNISIVAFGYDAIIKNERTGDSIYMDLSLGYSEMQFSFTLDSLEGNLKNFSINETINHGSFGYLSSTIQISSLNFSIRDSLLIVDMNGETTKNNIANVKYENDGPVNNCANRSHWFTSVTFDHLLDDTSQYKCSISLIITKPINSVQTLTSNNEALITSSIFSDHTTHFSFPSSDHPQPLIIFDILGREVKRIEIPSGVSEYSLQRDGFMSGYYFARLGNLGAKFVVSSQ